MEDTSSFWLLFGKFIKFYYIYFTEYKIIKNKNNKRSSENQIKRFKHQHTNTYTYLHIIVRQQQQTHDNFVVLFSVLQD